MSSTVVTQRPARAVWIAAPTLLLLVCTGCAIEPDSSPIRLVEIVDRSSVESSPLLDSETSLGDIQTRVVFEEDFRDFRPQDLGWPAERIKGLGAAVGEGSEGGGSALCFRGQSVLRHGILLPAEPNRRYRLTRRIRTEDPTFDLRLLESSLPLLAPDVLNDRRDINRLLTRRYVRTHELVRVRHFPPLDQVGEWQEGGLEFLTSPITRTFVILFEQLEGGNAFDAPELCLDSLKLEELEPTPAQEMALLRDAWRPPGSSDELGFAKRGQLLPLRRARNSRPPFDHNFDHRDALFAPAPTTLRFPIEPLEGTRFSFSYALADSSRPGDAATFEVLVEAGGQSEILFSETVRLDQKGASWYWHEAIVDLDEYSGKEVQLVLSTRTDSDRGFALWGSPIVDSPRRPSDPPNVLFIAIDTLRADRLSAYGHDRPTTPHIDRLAEDGVRFAQAISSCSWTTPSFASIFTGLPPSQHQVINRHRGVSPALTTIPERFRDAGWRTHAVAYKPFLYNLGFEQGFDQWFNVPASNVTAQNNLDKALDWLEDHHSSRFFLFFHLDDPHQPLNQPKPFDRRFNTIEDIERFGLRLPFLVKSIGTAGCKGCYSDGEIDEGFKTLARDLYDGAVAFTDDRIGSLIASLKEWGVYDDTIIVVIADHGEIMWDRDRMYGHGGFRLSDELIHVPFILKPQAGTGITRGQVIESQVRSADLAPTLLELAGLPVESDSLESSSLLPLLDDSSNSSDDRIAFTENPRHSVISVRHKGWKYVLRHLPLVAADERLIDLREDPQELSNRLEDAPRVLDALRAQITSYILRNRGGSFVLALGDGEERDYEMRITSSVEGPPPVVLFGLPPESVSEEGRTTLLRGHSAQRVLAFAELAEVVAGGRLEVELAGDGELVDRREAASGEWLDHSSAVLDRILSEAGPRIFLIKGNAPGITPELRTTENADQLEQLRALGYIE